MSAFVSMRSEKPVEEPYALAGQTDHVCAHVIVNEVRALPRNASRVIVFANEKGGVGKSTLSFHLCIQLCNAGHKVAAIDLDARQASLSRALEYREGTARRLGIKLPMPRYAALQHCSASLLRQEIARIGSGADYVVIDTPGHDAPIVRSAIAMANTLITPVNNSFVDIDLLGRFDAVTGKLKAVGHFTRLVQELRDAHDLRTQARAIDWIVVQNRLRRLGAHNGKRVEQALADLAPTAGYRTIAGLGERVIYRDLFLLGLTLFDLSRIPEFSRSQPAARAEIDAMIADMRLDRQLAVTAD